MKDQTCASHLPREPNLLDLLGDADTEQVTAGNKGDVELQKKSSPRSIIFSCTLLERQTTKKRLLDTRGTWKARRSHLPENVGKHDVLLASGEKYSSVQQPRASPRSATHDGSPEAEPCPTQTGVTVFVTIEISSPEGCGKFLVHGGITKAMSCIRVTAGHPVSSPINLIGPLGNSLTRHPSKKSLSCPSETPTLTTAMKEKVGSEHVVEIHMLLSP